MTDDGFDHSGKIGFREENRFGIYLRKLTGFTDGLEMEKEGKRNQRCLSFGFSN